MDSCQREFINVLFENFKQQPRCTIVKENANCFDVGAAASTNYYALPLSIPHSRERAYTGPWATEDRRPDLSLIKYSVLGGLVPRTSRSGRGGGAAPGWQGGAWGATAPPAANRNVSVAPKLNEKGVQQSGGHRPPVLNPRNAGGPEDWRAGS